VLAVTSSLALLECLRQEMKIREPAVRKRLKQPPAYAQLVRVNGIGEMLAQTIGLKTGDSGRFPTVGHSAASGGCVRRTTISNGKRKGQGNTKHGHPYLAWAYMEAAQFAIRCSPKVQRFSQRKVAKSPLMSARKSVAHTLARACFYRMRALGSFDGKKALG
jgi:transposase